MPEIIKYITEIAAADYGARRDFKSLSKSFYQLFKAGHIQDPKAKVGYHYIVIINIEEFHDNKLYFGRPYSFFCRNLPSK